MEAKHNQAHREDRLQSETAGPVNARDNEMVIDKLKNISNSNQCHMATSEPSSASTTSPGYANTPEKEDSQIQSPRKIIEDVKEDINNSLKEIQRTQINR